MNACEASRLACFKFKPNWSTASEDPRIPDLKPSNTVSTSYPKALDIIPADSNSF